MFKLKQIAHAVALLSVTGGFVQAAWADDAQSNSKSSETIYITGSSIRRTDAEGVENVQVIKKEQILESGKTNVADFMRTISGSNSSLNETFVNSFAAGAAGIALRGLSEKNTLVLLNGQRIANYGFAQNLEDTFVDLNVIPLSAVERIEVLKSGASAVYGSDAVAGVINIILTKQFTGGLVNVGGGVATEGGLGTEQANVMYGMGDLDKDRYNVMVSLSAFHRDALYGSQRSEFKNADLRNFPDGQLGYTPTGFYRTVEADGKTPVRVPLPNCGSAAVPGGVVTARDLGADIDGSECAANQENLSTLSPKTDRYNVVSNANVKLGSDLTAFGDVFFSHDRTTAITGGPMTLSGGSVHYDPTTGGVAPVDNHLPVGNPSNPYAKPTRITYAFTSVGDPTYIVNANASRVSGGLKGAVKDWDWNVTLGHSESDVRQSYYNQISVSALTNAIATGSYNFLNPTQAQSNALRTGYTQKSVSKLDDINANADGSIFALPAGDLRGAVGVEFRRESLANTPDPRLTSGDILDYGFVAVNGSRNVGAIHAELSIPVIENLEGDVALREERYSDAGRNFSPQLSVRWQPTKEVLFRATTSRGFRAPSLPEISHSSSLSFQTVYDPHDFYHRQSEPVGVVQVANPALQPETSSNYDLGMVLSPTKDFNLTVDYFRILVHNAIATSNNAQSMLLSSGGFGQQGSGPGTIHWGSDQTVSYVEVPYGNLYEFMERGADFDISQRFHLPGAQVLAFDLTGTYVDKMGANTQQYGPIVNFAGSNAWLIQSPLAGGGAVPRWRGALSGEWSTASWISRATMNFTGSYHNYGFDINQNPNSPHVRSQTTFDLYEEYKGIKNWRFYGSVTNLLNKQPPWDSNAGGYDQGLYDATGRFVSVNAEYKF